ncbi:mandelate racemase/muconate lactonizing enzyme family protein [Rathayibacter soli]|uniref:mandelate racemase/muconate lactonizing enzyme family protein n=1 Tax=Rathayibacter soli TaxID=3144168 RepID=UPI0027E5078F|nr:dipeptide epimerase [Glaciibacter superstes]
MITEILVHRVSVPLLRPFVTAQRSASAHDAVLVELHDDSGRSGWGEAPCSWRVTGESPAGVTAAVTGPLADVVVGRAVADLAELADALGSAVIRNSAAKMAVDCALHDLAAQETGESLAVFLGGPDAARIRVTTDMTLSAGNPDDVAALAREHRDAGFDTLKVKCGGGGDDQALLRAVRDAVGASVVLRVDANQGWDREQAIRIIRFWENDGVDVAFVEQPVAARAIDDLAAVRRAVDTPVLADESVWDHYDLHELIRRQAADMVNIKLAKSGGIREAMRMARQAKDAGIGVLIGSMMESTVGIAAAASLSASVGLTAPQDLDAGLWLSASPVVGGARYDGRNVQLSPATGLGIEGLSG